jgi:hypothetical protein
MHRIPTTVSLLLFAAASPTQGQAMVDHLVFAAPSLEEGVRFIERALGVTATPGGQHLGLGTRNALVSLGSDVYLEIIGPDPDQPDPAQARPFGIDDLTEPRLVTWAARGTGLTALVEAVGKAGTDLGEVIEMSRQRPDGTLLSWELSSPFVSRADGVVPFLIDWMDSEHPARSLPTGPKLLDLVVEHPDPDAVAAALAAMGSQVEVVHADAPGLVARVRTEKGILELR